MDKNANANPIRNDLDLKNHIPSHRKKIGGDMSSIVRIKFLQL